MDREIHGWVILKRQIIAAAVAAADIGTAAGVSSVGSGAAAVQGVGAVFDNDRLGCRVENIASRHLGFGHHHGAVGDEARHSDGPICPGGIAAQQVPIAVLHSEGRVGDGLAGDGVQLGQRQAAQGIVEEG